MQSHNISYGHSHLTRTLNQPVRDVDGLIRDSHRRGAVPGSSQAGPLADPDGMMAAQNQAVPHSATILEGVVNYVIPGSFTYRVVLNSGLGVLICNDIHNTSFTRSVRISKLFPVGSRVIVLRQSPTRGVILGSPARDVLDRQYGLPVLYSGIGTFHAVNRGYVRNAAMSPDLSRSVPDFVQGRAVDVCEGDYIISNMFEGGFFTSPHETGIRQSHDCGVWMFMMDRLLRIVGRSVQEYSFAHERYAGMDEHETYGFTGMAAYPWEAMGYYHKPGTPLKKNESHEVVLGKGISFIEPTEPKAEPFYRHQVFTGYLGQGVTQEIRIPPQGIHESEEPVPHLPDDDKVPICVARQQMLLDGTILHESAKAIYSVKHVNLRSFQRKHAIDDPRGDDMAKGDTSTYQFSGAESPGTPPQGTTDPILWTLRKQSPALFRAHKGDFQEIDKDERASEKDVNLAQDLSALRYADSVAEPPTVPLHVDDRYGKVDYGGGRSVIAQLPNGDIVFRNACGAEIALRGSNIEISAPGDLRIIMGRSVITLAGDDAVIRAKNSVDVTATDNDVRIKAERNLDLAGGMSGSGRTLLENQATGSPNNQDVAGLEGERINGRGLILKAAGSMVETLGKSVYLRSLEKGHITLDADQGEGSVRIDSRTTRIHGASSIVIAATPPNEGVLNLVIVTPTRTISRAMIECHARIIALGAIASDSGISTSAADNFSQPAEYPRTRQLDEQVQNFIEAMPEWFTTTFWDEEKPGHADTIKNTAFSYRTTDQYGAGRFRFEQPYWMELYGQDACESLPTWSEPVYVYQGTMNQQPWPGYETWSVEQSLETATTRMYDAEQGLDLDEPIETQQEKIIPDKFLRITDPG